MIHCTPHAHCTHSKTSAVTNAWALAPVAILGWGLASAGLLSILSRGRHTHQLFPRPDCPRKHWVREKMHSWSLASTEFTWKQRAAGPEARQGDDQGACSGMAHLPLSAPCPPARSAPAAAQRAGDRKAPRPRASDGSGTRTLPRAGCPAGSRIALLAGPRFPASRQTPSRSRSRGSTASINCASCR